MYLKREIPGVFANWPVRAIFYDPPSQPPFYGVQSFLGRVRGASVGSRCMHWRTPNARMHCTQKGMSSAGLFVRTFWRACKPLA